MVFYTQKVIHETTQGPIEATLIDTLKGIYVLDKPFFYSIEFKGQLNVFHIDKGFYTNFASIPLKLKNVISPISKGFLAASVIHDFILNEFEYMQPKLDRKFTLEGEIQDVREFFDWDTAVEIFHDILVQEKAFNTFSRKVIKSCVKIWARLDPEVRHRFMNH